MTTETKLKAALVSSFLMILWLAVMWSNSDAKIIKQKEEIDNLSTIVDSIFQESFGLNVEVGRYELTLDHFKDVNPNAAKEFMDYMSHETE
jgi:hypothetical protein